MSRFRPQISPPGKAFTRLAPVLPASVPVAANGSTPRSEVPTPQASMLQILGFWMLCAFLLSGMANDWALRLFGGKAYISTVMLVLLPVAWLITGRSLSGLRHPMGRWWLAFLVWMVLATPFSVYKTGSIVMLENYIPRSYLLLFYIATFAVSLRFCRYLMYVNIIVAISLIVTCLISGTYSEDERFYLPGGGRMFENANHLALFLLLGITQLIYLFSRRNLPAKLIAAVGIGVSVPLMLKTGSRGCLLAGLVYIIAFLIINNRRRLFIPLAVFAIAAGLLSVSQSTLNRLSQFGMGEETDVSAAQSRMSRVELLKRSVWETVTHPLFGVGPDQFPVQVAEEAKQEGVWVQWLGTHNAYTQVSSECGIPALIFYCAVIVITWRMNYRMYKTTRNSPKHREIAALSAALLSGIVVYAVSIFFFHMAYTSILPSLAGLTLAVHNSSKVLLKADFGVSL